MKKDLIKKKEAKKSVSGNKVSNLKEIKKTQTKKTASKTAEKKPADTKKKIVKTAKKETISKKTPINNTAKSSGVINPSALIKKTAQNNTKSTLKTDKKAITGKPAAKASAVKLKSAVKSFQSDKKIEKKPIKPAVKPEKIDTPIIKQSNESQDMSLPEGSALQQTGQRRPLIVFPK